MTVVVFLFLDQNIACYEVQTRGGQIDPNMDSIVKNAGIGIETTVAREDRYFVSILQV